MNTAGNVTDDPPTTAYADIDPALDRGSKVTLIVLSSTGTHFYRLKSYEYMV